MSEHPLGRPDPAGDLAEPLNSGSRFASHQRDETQPTPGEHDAPCVSQSASGVSLVDPELLLEHKNLFDLDLLTFLLQNAGFHRVRAIEEQDLLNALPDVRARADDEQSIYVVAER